MKTREELDRNWAKFSAAMVFIDADVIHQAREELKQLIAEERAYREAALDSIVQHPGIYADCHDTWVEIGKRCSSGRRSMWMKLVFVPGGPHNVADSNTVESIELKAGREGEDSEMSITRDNPQFARLLDLFLTAHFAATT